MTILKTIQQPKHIAARGPGAASPFAITTRNGAHRRTTTARSLSFWCWRGRRLARYREVFDQFDPAIVATYGPEKGEQLLADPGIIRNRGKIAAAIQNARAVLAIRESFGSFDTYLWQFVGDQPRINAWRTLAEIPAETAESRALSKDLKRRGCSFVGATICYAFMQATGMVNDHTIDCFRYQQLSQHS